MSNVNFGKKPQGFRLMDEGNQTLLITEIKGLPRANVTNVEVKFINEDGIKLTNKYDLTNDGGYGAFYYLVQNGCGIELDGEFDIDTLVGKYVEVEIVHKEGTRPREDGSMAIFANIRSTVGVGVPFGDDAELDARETAGDEWED